MNCQLIVYIVPLLSVYFRLILPRILLTWWIRLVLFALQSMGERERERKWVNGENCMSNWEMSAIGSPHRRLLRTLISVIKMLFYLFVVNIEEGGWELGLFIIFFPNRATKARRKIHSILFIAIKMWFALRVSICVTFCVSPTRVRLLE